MLDTRETFGMITGKNKRNNNKNYKLIIDKARTKQSSQNSIINKCIWISMGRAQRTWVVFVNRTSFIFITATQ